MDKQSEVYNGVFFGRKNEWYKLPHGWTLKILSERSQTQRQILYASIYKKCPGLPWQSSGKGPMFPMQGQGSIPGQGPRSHMP